MKRLLPTLLLLLTSCGSFQIPGLEHTPPPMPEPPLPQVEEEVSAAGSLWRGDTSRRFLAFENRAKRVGDLITVQISESATAETEATTDLKRKSTHAVDVDSDVSLQTLATRPILRVLNWLGFSEQHGDKTPEGNVDVLDAESTANFKGQGTSEREASFTTTVACLVTEVLPSGLMHISGERHLRINREVQVIRISGWVRPEDVRIENTISSTLIANADIHYDGVGVVAEQQRQPWATRVLNLILPF